MLAGVPVVVAETVNVLNVQQQCLQVNQRTLEFIGGLQRMTSTLIASPHVSDDDDDDERINFSVALSPKITRTCNNKPKQ